VVTAKIEPSKTRAKSEEKEKFQGKNEPAKK
jgi:hypothetical protein